MWVQKSKSMRKSMHTRHRFTVQQVEPSSLEVLWYSCDSGYPAKAEDLKPEDIKKYFFCSSLFVDLFSLPLG